MKKTLSNFSSLGDNVVSISNTFFKRYHSDEDDEHSNDFLRKITIQSDGKIRFNSNEINDTHFIRISWNSSPIELKEYLIRQCANKHPSLIISMTNSSKEYSIKSKLFRILQENLLKVAKTNNIWIVTNGMNTSLTKMIGEIVRSNVDPTRSIYLIGIVNWGCLSSEDQTNLNGRNVLYGIQTKDENILQSNHHQFIFIDNGTNDRHPNEMEFRLKFERFLSHPSSQLQTNEQQISSSQMAIPVVVLVIEGDLETIQIVHQSILQNEIPCVLLEGTGECCDLFAQINQLYKEYHHKSPQKKSHGSKNLSGREKEYLKKRIREKVRIQDPALSPSANIGDNNCSVDYFDLIYECIEKRAIFLNFVDFKARYQFDPDLDLAILQAILLATSTNDPTNQQKQLQLALDWNRVDVVQKLIIKDEQDWKTIDLNDIFGKALLRNQIDFIQLFLDHGFPLDQFFSNNNKLLMLYKHQNYCVRDDSMEPLRAIYTEIIQPLLGDSFEVDAVLSSDEIKHEEHLDNPYLRCIISKSEEHNRINDFYKHRQNNKANKCGVSFGNGHMDVNKELFLWSVLAGKQSLALLFWSRGKNKICGALLATFLYKVKARKDNDRRSTELADEFQKLAVQILENFYRCDPHTCTKAIFRQIPEFGNMTWLHLAVMAEDKQFIAQKAVQNVLSDIWYGFIDHTVGNRWIIFSTWIIWYSAFLPYHRELIEKTEMIPQSDDTPQTFTFIQCDVSQATPLNSKFADKDEEEEEKESVAGRSCLKKRTRGLDQYLRNMLMFFHAPFVKYLYHLYSHVIFLLLFSYVVLCDFFPLYEFHSTKCLSGSEEITFTDLTDHPLMDRSGRNQTFEYGLTPHHRPSTSELILSFWVFTLLCEEIRQLISIENPTISKKVVVYLSVFWNKLDVLGITLYFLGFALRFSSSNQCFCAARLILAVDLSLWYIRILDIFASVKRLGPKLVMIGEMVHDLTFFMLILTVFVLAFGVPTYTLLFGVQKFTWHLPRAILNIAYWQIFGELEVIDEIERNYEISGYVVFVLLIAYMTMASVLLINLLIAMFSNTFDRLHMDTDCIWKFQHYYAVCYHLTRPCFPPPLIIFSHLWRTTLYIFSHLIPINWFTNQYVQHKNREKFKIVANEKLRRDIEGIEDTLGNEVYYFFSKTNQKPMGRRTRFHEEQIHSPHEILLNKMKTLETDIQSIHTQQMNMFQYLECLINGMKKIAGDDIQMPRQHHLDSD